MIGCNSQRAKLRSHHKLLNCESQWVAVKLLRADKMLLLRNPVNTSILSLMSRLMSTSLVAASSACFKNGDRGKMSCKDAWAGHKGYCL